MKVIGSFVFRNEGAGCLTGKWLNEDTPKPLVECASLMVNPNENATFVGLYRTTYIDIDNQSHFRYLKIEMRNAGVYSLEWSENEDFRDLSFVGWGMLIEGLLVGHYRTQIIE